MDQSYLSSSTGRTVPISGKIICRGGETVPMGEEIIPNIQVSI